MRSERTVIAALGVALVLVAMPASAGWYYNPEPSTPGELLDDPSDITEFGFDLPPTDLGNDTLPVVAPVLLSIQSETINGGPQIAQVPEPGTLSLLALALLGVGLTGLGIGRRRRA
jgi:hypothetical protein